MDRHRKGARPFGELMRRKPRNASFELVQKIRSAPRRGKIASEDKPDIAIHTLNFWTVSQDEDGFDRGRALDELDEARFNEPFGDGLVERSDASPSVMFEGESTVRVKSLEELGERCAFRVEELSNRPEILDDRGTKMAAESGLVVRKLFERLVGALT